MSQGIELTAEDKERFLAALREHGWLDAAAAAVGIARTTGQAIMRDPEYGERAKAARAEGLEAYAERISRDGWTGKYEKSKFAQGILAMHIRTFHPAYHDTAKAVLNLTTPGLTAEQYALMRAEVKEELRAEQKALARHLKDELED